MGTGAKSPSALAPFAHNWVGGDIHGLSAYAGTLYGYVPRLSDVATALDKKVSQIVGDAGWKGSAAAAFTKAWQHDATGATALAVMVSAAGDVVNTLAVNLASVESALEAAADTATAHGVPVGAGGQPPQECFADATKESWRVSYQSFWNQSMLLAATARSQAAAALAQLGTAATEGGGDAGLGNGDYTALFDTLAGFFGALGVSGVGLTLAAGGAGVLAGGVVAYGVGDFAHNLIQENWGADISKHGVILGIGDGIGDSAVKTGQDFVKVGSGIAHGVEHAWDSIF